jgi:AraC family transcriptional regulator, regulatory protein of adaptative response / methylated-DNA-[protein]-cysteine methyltransferase
MTRAPRMSTAASWRSVALRDRGADGQFVYVALTTSIYCRPSCPARLPHRRNMRILRSATEAERRGYSACLRCHPGSLAPAEAAVTAALHHIRTDPDLIVTLKSLSRISGLSPNHLQRMFTRIVGVSPKVFLDHHRLTRFKGLLRHAKSVSGASYAAGYGSIRAVYEKTDKSLGMTPAIYRAGGTGATVRYAMASVPWGRVVVASTERGICMIRVGARDADLAAEVAIEFPRATLVRERRMPTPWMAALRICQIEDPVLTGLAVAVRVDVFQAKVWSALSR